MRAKVRFALAFKLYPERRLVLKNHAEYTYYHVFTYIIIILLFMIMNYSDFSTKVKAQFNML